MPASERRLIWVVSFSHFITHSYMSMLPALLSTIAAEYSMSFMDLGLIANIGYFLYGLGAFPVGFLADRFGAKRMLVVGVLVMSVASLLVGLASSTFSFAVAYSLLGMGASIHHPAGLALLARHVRVKGRAMGFHGVLGNVGIFITPLAAVMSVTLFGAWRAAYLIYGVIGLGFLLVLYFTRIEQEETELAAAAVKGRAPQPAAAAVAEQSASGSTIPVTLLLLYAGSILSGFIFRGSLTFFPVLFQREVHAIASHDQPVVMAGYATSAVLSLGLIGAWFGGWINDRIKRPEMVPVVIFLTVAPILWLISRSTDFGLLAVSALFSLIYYAWQPSQNYLIARYSKRSSYGVGFGISFFLVFGMGSIATLVGGYVADQFGVDKFYYIMAGIALVALLVALAVNVLPSYRRRFASGCLVKEGSSG